MRLHGISRDVFDRYRSTAPSWQYEVVAPGFKYNLTDTAAAMGRVQLHRVEAMRDRRAAIAARYDAAFDGLAVQGPPPGSAGDQHAWHLYVLQVDADAGVDRDGFVGQMAKLGVGTSVHFIPLHRHPYWRDRYRLCDDGYPVASAAFGRTVSLPIFSAMSDSQVERVVDAVTTVLE